MSEIQEAVQVVSVTIEGIKVTAELTGDAIDLFKDIIAFFRDLLDRDKIAGKTNMKELLKQGTDLQVFQFESEDLKTVEKYAKKYGILYSVLPDLNSKDGMSEIIFHSSAVPRVQMLASKIKNSKIQSVEDYIDNREDKEKTEHEEAEVVEDEPEPEKKRTEKKAKTTEPDAPLNDFDYLITAKLIIDNPDIHIKDLCDKTGISAFNMQTILESFYAKGILELDKDNKTVRMTVTYDEFLDMIRTPHTKRDNEKQYDGEVFELFDSEYVYEPEPEPDITPEPEPEVTPEESKEAESKKADSPKRDETRTRQADRPKKQTQAQEDVINQYFANQQHRNNQPDNSDPDVKHIWIAKKMIVQETESRICTRIPYTQKFRWIEKKDILDVSPNGTVHTTMNMNKKYEIETDFGDRTALGRDLWLSNYTPDKNRKNYNGNQQSQQYKDRKPQNKTGRNNNYKSSRRPNKKSSNNRKKR